MLLITYSGLGFWNKYSRTHSYHPLPSSSLTINTNSNKPDETPINPNSSYQVPANQPRMISLPTIKASGFIQKVDLTKDNALGTPNSVFMAGWYVGMVKPGDNGVSIIDGHVQGYYNPGIFKHLDSLKPGDTFTVQFGNLSSRQFEVVSVTSYSVSDIAQHMFVQQTGINKQLNLITCGGNYSPATQEYDRRVLVVSKLVG
jgi:LPXTG-site transpeptidase (sortase) family protein